MPEVQDVWCARKKEKRKKYGHPNTSMQDKTRSPVRKICQSGVRKFFKVNVLAKVLPLMVSWPMSNLLSKVSGLENRLTSTRRTYEDSRMDESSIDQLLARAQAITKGKVIEESRAFAAVRTTQHEMRKFPPGDPMWFQIMPSLQQSQSFCKGLHTGR